MAGIKAFRGYRYQLENSQDLGLYTAPPYDMIDSAMIDKLYGLNPLNAVRIIQNKPEDGDRENADRHKRASAILQHWIDEGKIVQDPEPSLYIYKQKFSTQINGVTKSCERTGVVLLVELVNFEKKIVFPHEYTLSGPKQDRYELLDASRTNTGQIFGLVPDKGDLYQAIQNLRGDNEPLGQFTDENSVVHSIYNCHDSALIEQLRALLDDRSILIADGHHRYETALRFYNDKGDAKYSHLMMTLVSMADPGLVIRPFHRMVRKTDLADKVDMLQSLKRYFEIRKIDTASEEAVTQALGTIDTQSSEMVYWDCDSSKLYMLKINADGEEFLQQSMQEHTSLWKHLEVSVINMIVINRILDLPLDGHVLHDVMEYVNDVPKSAELLGTPDQFYGGFFIKPLSIMTINDIVKGGERMPQKSTNFYPKLFSGLVFNRME